MAQFDKTKSKVELKLDVITSLEVELKQACPSTRVEITLREANDLRALVGTCRKVPSILISW